MNEEIGLEDFRLAIIELWRKKLLIIAVALLFFLIALLATFNMKPKNIYMAHATVYSAFYGSYEESLDAAVAMVNYSDVLTSNKVCERAASIVGDANITAADIKSMVSTYAKSSSIVMDIYTTSDVPSRAVAVANAVAQAFVIEIRSITASDAIQVLDDANKATMASNGSRMIWMIRLIGLVAGGALATAFVFLRELFSDRIRSMKQVETYEENILGVIPTLKNEKGV